MGKTLRRPLSVALVALATTTLGGCYYGDVYGSSYAGGDCATRYGADYYDYDGYAYDDGYGYDCYDGSDYGSGFAQIGFGGGWYDNYYYPGYGLWLFDSYNNRYPLRGQYLNYWGGRRAWWKHHGGDGNWNRPGRGDGHGDGRPGRPGGWNGHPGRGDGHGNGQPGPGAGNGNNGTPPTTNPGRPDRPWVGRPPRGDGNSVRPRPPGADAPVGSPDGSAVTPPRNWTPRNPGAAGRPPRQAPMGQPGGYRPAPTPQATAPAPVRSAPPAVRSESRPAPQGRAPRVDRPNHARED